MEWKDNVSAKSHQYTAENRDNVKFVSPYGGFHEIIFDVNKEEVTNARDRGTFNFIPSGISGIGHGIIDVFPWIIWGNSEDDTTTVYERIQSLSR